MPVQLPPPQDQYQTELVRELTRILNEQEVLIERLTERIAELERTSTSAG